MTVLSEINELKIRLIDLYNQYGKLSHPEVLQTSRQLDEKILEYYRAQEEIHHAV